MDTSPFHLAVDVVTGGGDDNPGPGPRPRRSRTADRRLAAREHRTPDWAIGLIENAVEPALQIAIVVVVAWLVLWLPAGCCVGPSPA